MGISHDETTAMVEAARHGHIDMLHLLNLLTEALGREDWARVRDAAQELDAHLQQHFELEEKVLFPLLRQRVSHELMTRFLEEHLEGLRTITLIGRMLERMTGTEVTSSAAVLEGIIDSLKHLMVQHAEIEERFLYQATDAVLSEDDQRALLQPL